MMSVTEPIDTQAIIKSWRWRIVKAGHNQASFAEHIDISRAAMCEYLCGKKAPSLEVFEMIQNELFKLGA